MNMPEGHQRILEIVSNLEHATAMAVRAQEGYDHSTPEMANKPDVAFLRLHKTKVIALGPGELDGQPKVALAIETIGNEEEGRIADMAQAWREGQFGPPTMVISCQCLIGPFFVTIITDILGRSKYGFVMMTPAEDNTAVFKEIERPDDLPFEMEAMENELFQTWVKLLRQFWES